MTIDECMNEFWRGGVDRERYVELLSQLVRTETERCAAVIEHAKNIAKTGGAYLTVTVLQSCKDAIFRTAPDTKQPPSSVQDELLAACRTCETAATKVLGAPFALRETADWTNLRASTHLARRAIERAEKEKT